MKKLFALMMLCGVLSTAPAFAQGTTTQNTDAATTTTTTDQADTAAAAQEPATTTTTTTPPTTTGFTEDEPATEDAGFHQNVKQKFIEGGWQFMGIVLLCLILGLAVAIERIITLNMATTNTKKLLARVEDALATGGVEAAKDVTRNNSSPVASIFTQGLMRSSEGIDMVEKSIISYGSVEMGRLERGLVWISLFISLAPMLGFMGTVLGMIEAFDNIERQGDISPVVVANGIKIALLTTVAGLIVAVILQLFYNYCVSKIDSLVNKMEDASIALVDMLVRNQLARR
jgi:biopolymer transport protein ExbB